MKKSLLPESALEQLVEKKLKEAGFEYETQPIVGKGRPDFLVRTPDGKEIVLEVKGWSENPENIKRAAHQAKIYKKLTNAASYIAMTGLSSAIPGLGLLPVTGIVEALLDAFKTVRERPKGVIERAMTHSVDKRIFSAMPFSPKYDDTFLVAMQPATIHIGAICERVDHSGHYGDIVVQIKSMISKSVAVIADLSESRPNVCYEIGLADAFGKPVIQICSTPKDQLPFDLRNNLTIQYTIGQTMKLRGHLIKELQKIEGLANKGLERSR
jgi:hypothetical protein